MSGVMPMSESGVMPMSEPIWGWGMFFAIVLLLLALDLGVFNRKSRIVSARRSVVLTVFYMIMAMAFGAWVWQAFGHIKGREFLSGYLVEMTLSLDNIFVMSLIFIYFRIPREFQHRVLLWGILGAIVLRGLAIGAGTIIIAQFEWVLLLFAAFLIFTGIKMLMGDDEPEGDFSENRVLRLMQKFLPITPALHGNKFMVRLPSDAGMKRFFTPLFLALVLVECADIVFAVDSIPAIFSITTDPFIIYTSNIFAILGLRSMYFLLCAALYRFEYLKYAVSAILVFIGVQVLLEHLVRPDMVPPVLSFGVIIGLLAIGVLYSLLKTSRSDSQELS